MPRNKKGIIIKWGEREIVMDTEYGLIIRERWCELEAERIGGNAYPAYKKKGKKNLCCVRG